MRVLPFKIPKTEDASFVVQIDNEKYFYDTLHQHPEVQLTLIIESTGTLILGDYIGSFKPGDIFVIGANVPHVFRNDKAYYDGEAKSKAHAISLFFDEETFGSRFFTLPETKEVLAFLDRSLKGLKVTGTKRTELEHRILSIQYEKGLNRMIRFLELLKLLCSPEDVTFLMAEILEGSVKETEAKRLNSIFQFTMKEYGREISLDEVASLANMVPSAFCRYFKKRTRKTYIQFLTEIRIKEACKILTQGNTPVSEACYQVGFSNLSNFNRKFKFVTGFTPRDYKKQYEYKS